MILFHLDVSREETLGGREKYTIQRETDKWKRKYVFPGEASIH
jgi:hypothetical protein